MAHFHSLFAHLALLDMQQLFFASLIGIALMLCYLPRLAAVPRAQLLRGSRRAFDSTPQEAPKFALIRIGFGIILTWRAYYLWILLSPADHATPLIQEFALLNLLTGLALIFGFLSHYALAFLMLVQWQRGETILGNGTLGNDIAAILALLLLLTNSGRYLSIDGWLGRRWPVLRSWLLHYPSDPTPETLTIAKWVALFSYWLVCLYSLSMHLNEQAWMSGTAGPLLLSNNFMSTPYGWFIHLFEQHGWAVHLARLALWMMLPWYLFLLPAVMLGGWTRRYAIVWGLLFFGLSKFVLNLGWLAEIEFLLWAGLFWSKTGIAHPQRFAIAYDDTCNLCDRTVQLVRIADCFDRAVLKPAGKNKAWLTKHGISYARAMEDLHGIDTVTGRICAGYDFYIELARQIVLLWPLYPVLLLGKWLGIGPAIYRFIAARRTAMFGVCKLPSPKRPATVYATEPADAVQPLFVMAVTLHVILLGLFYVLATPAPYVGRTGWPNPFARAAHIYGIAPINVFNAYDLGLAENWFTVSRLEGKSETLLPILSPEGTRLAYHRSDRIYFGETLYFRRMVIGQPGCAWNMRPVIEYLTGLYADQEKLPAGTYRFRYRQYYQKLPDSDLLRQNRYVSNPTAIRCTRDFTLAIP